MQRAGGKTPTETEWAMQARASMRAVAAARIDLCQQQRRLADAERDFRQDVMHLISLQALPLVRKAHQWHVKWSNHTGASWQRKLEFMDLIVAVRRLRIYGIPEMRRFKEAMLVWVLNGAAVVFT